MITRHQLIFCIWYILMTPTLCRHSIDHSQRHHRYRHHPDHRYDSNRNIRSTNVRVHTKSGELEGLSIDINGKKVHAFYGVPFAEPPIHELRFKVPKPVKPWTKAFQATKPAKSCYQGSDQEYKFRGADMWNRKTERSEDCLVMNIWAPADAQNATVMVWLFGGGFWYGSASLDIYNGLGLAAEGQVIVVTPNYRLGVFGFLFLDHPEVPGNLGLVDQQMALRWIKDNIAAFGGDPNKVNLFGESAGAASIVAHMVSKESWPLFHNGILQSGSLDNPWAMDSPSKAFNRSMIVVESVGCVHSRVSDMVKCLRNKTADELDNAMWNIGINYLEFPLVIVSKDRAGFFNADAYRSLRDGHYRPNTDLMFGINQDEGTFWMAYYDLKQYFNPFNVTAGGGQEKLTNASRFSECVNEVILKGKPQAYKSAVLWEYNNGSASCQRSNEESIFYRNQLNQLIGDYYFTCDSLWLADDMVKRNRGKVYVYHFEQRIGSNPWPQWMGVMHGYEIEYVFGLPLLSTHHHHQYVSGYENGGNNRQNYYNYTKDDRELTKDIIHYWTTFATNGVHVHKTFRDKVPWCRITEACLNDEYNLQSIEEIGVPKIRGPVGRKFEWPEYTLDEKTWYILRANSKGDILKNQKQSECKMWRSIRDIDYSLYEAKYLSSANIMSFPFENLLMIMIISIIWNVTV